MISRKSAKLIADAYKTAFSYTYSSSTSSYSSSSTFCFKRDELYEFLYEEDYEAWFLNLIKGMHEYNHTRELLEFVMSLHTGESVTSATKNWTWEERKKLGQRYLKDIAEDIIKLFENKPIEPYSSDKQVKEIIKSIKAQLELDGYIYRDGMLLYSESSVIDEQEEQGYLESLVDKLSLADKEVIKHHITLAEEHYVSGKWGDSISNSRNFLEAILQQTANALNKKKYGAVLPVKTFERPVLVRDYLESEKLIETKEKEAVAKVYGLLSDTGSHPNIAEKDQARLMWHLALTFSQFVLLRFEGFLKNNP